MTTLSQNMAALSQGHVAMQQAMALLIQNHAAFVGELREAEKGREKLERRYSKLRNEGDKRYVKIQSILAEHTRLLEQLPEAVQARMGFKP